MPVRGLPNAEFDASRMQELEDGDLSAQKPDPSKWRKDRNDLEEGSAHSITGSSEEGNYEDETPRLNGLTLRDRGQSFPSSRLPQHEESLDLGDIAVGSSKLLEEDERARVSGSLVRDNFQSPQSAQQIIGAQPMYDKSTSHDLGEIGIRGHLEDESGSVKKAGHNSLEGTAVADQPTPEAAEISHDPVSNTLGHPVPSSPVAHHTHTATLSEWSHHQLTSPDDDVGSEQREAEWQTMPVYAPFDIYDDDGKLFAREAIEETGGSGAEASGSNLGGAARGYTRVQVDDDAQSATSMDDNTAYLFKEPSTTVDQDDDEQRDPLAQMQATKNLLTDNQRIAYVGVVRLALAEMAREIHSMERTKGTKKEVDLAYEAVTLWSQKMMVRLYGHMELEPAEQVMIEQLAEHGLQPGDLTPSLMMNARVKNPVLQPDTTKLATPERSITPAAIKPSPKSRRSSGDAGAVRGDDSLDPPPYEELDGANMPGVRTPSQLPNTEKIDIDLRWTVLCDLFLILIADSVYDSRSRALLERVGAFLDVSWLDICRFEKRVTDALEMQEAANKENWDEAEHLESRKKRARRRRLMFMGLATVGGGLVIGLSAGMLAPVIGAGLAAGLTTIGVTGTSTFLAGAGGAAVIGTGAAMTGGTIGIRAANRRTGAVKTFEYRPLHNNKRVNLIVTVAGWMNGKVDDVRLPYSTVDPIMGDMYSILWEPEMLRSMGDTINILATEALTQGLQQVLGSTILMGLMAALQLPIVLTKLSYLIDNPWSVSQARADMAGLILADSLIDRNLGARPITLVGFSLGSRVIFSCLRELAKRGAVGIIQNAYLFGSPVVVKKDEYLKVKTIVPGRFVNGYATNDWILGYLFRATSGGIMRVAGLAKVDIPGIENIDVTEFVPGHMAYRKAMPRLLREVGWSIESDDFTEIEDPDPDNHEKRQRELINEIEEARKELQEQPAKRRFGIFRSKQKRAQKKEWETYDERSKGTLQGDDLGEGASGSSSVLFDIDAIRKEAIELAAQGIELREVKSTLPPMILNTRKSDPMVPALKLDPSSPIPTSPTSRRRSTLRSTQSFEGRSLPVENDRSIGATRSLDFRRSEHSSYDGSADEDITLTFESPRPRHTQDFSMNFERPQWKNHDTIGQRPYGTTPSHFESNSFHDDRSALSFENPVRRTSSPSNWGNVDSSSRRTDTNGRDDKLSIRPPLRQQTGSASSVPSYKHNVWAGEDDLSKEGEMEMTFE